MPAGYYACRDSSEVFMMHGTLKVNPAWVFDANVDDFEAKVLENSRRQPLMVDFWAEWCSPCLVLAPVLDRVTMELAGRLLLAKVEVDDNMKLAGRYKLRGFPTVILFHHGAELGRFSGARGQAGVMGFLRDHLGDQWCRDGSTP